MHSRTTFCSPPGSAAARNNCEAIHVITRRANDALAPFSLVSSLSPCASRQSNNTYFSANFFITRTASRAADSTRTRFSDSRGNAYADGLCARYIHTNALFPFPSAKLFPARAPSVFESLKCERENGGVVVEAISGAVSEQIILLN